MGQYRQHRQDLGRTQYGNARPARSHKLGPKRRIQPRRQVDRLGERGRDCEDLAGASGTESVKVSSRAIGSTAELDGSSRSRRYNSCPIYLWTLLATTEAL